MQNHAWMILCYRVLNIVFFLKIERGKSPEYFKTFQKTQYYNWNVLEDDSYRYTPAR